MECNRTKGSNASRTRHMAMSLMKTRVASRVTVWPRDVHVTPPKADMCGATRDVHFGPKADMGVWLSSVYQLIYDSQHCRRDRETKLFCGI
jgi:hypothetical protein